MAYHNRNMLRDSKGREIPQYYDPIDDAFKPNTNEVRVLGNHAQGEFRGSSNTLKEFTEKMTGFVISNDGAKSIYFNIHRSTYEAKAGEVFKESFAPFDKVIVLSDGVPFRAYGLNGRDPKFEVRSLASDTFARADNASTLGNLESGQAWEPYNNVGASMVWSITGGKAFSGTTSGQFSTAVVDTKMPDEFAVEADITMLGGAGNYGGLMISLLDAKNNLFFRGNSGTSIMLFKTINGVFTSLKSVPYTYADGSIVKFRATKKGKDIEIFANGTRILTHTISDTEYMQTLSGKQGLFAKHPTTAFDNFKVETLGV